VGSAADSVTSRGMRWGPLGLIRGRCPVTMTPVSVTEYLADDAGYAAFARRLASRPAHGDGTSAASWVRRLPGLLGSLIEEWQLVPAGPTWSGRAAIVVPVDRDGQALALRVSWPQGDSPKDHVALRAWGGHGAVRLVAADPGRRALLLERLDASSDLTRAPIDEACETVGRLLARLAIAAPPSIPALADVHRTRVDRLRTYDSGVPRRVASRAVALFDELSSASSGPSTSATPRLLHGDLQFGHVLCGDREPWLAISPRPVAGPAAADVHAVLRHRRREYGGGSAFRWTVRRRLEIVADAAGEDADLARLWCIVHASLDAAASAAEGRSEETSFQVALVKALED
jgi:streptomycin 6-kinase